MNLVIDIGNTRIKAAVFENGVLKDKSVYDTLKDFLLDSQLYSPTKNIIIASVTKDHEQIIPSLSDKRLLLFSNKTALPISNSYKSPETLGADRLAASIGAYCFFQSKNVLTIDAGTCIKYNFVNEHNEFIGGAISPGVAMRFKALHEFTSALPLINQEVHYDKLTGTDTRESLLSGVMLGASAEVEKIIEWYQKEYDDLKVVLTGGDSPYLSKQLKNRFFTDPNIILYGLNKILEFNIEK